MLITNKGRFFIEFNFEVGNAEYCDLKNLDHYNPNGRKMIRMWIIKLKRYSEKKDENLEFGGFRLLESRERPRR